MKIQLNAWWRKFKQSPQLRQNVLLFTLLFLFGVIVAGHVSQVSKARKANSLAALYKERQAQYEQAVAQHESLLAENVRLLAEKEKVIARVLSQKGEPTLMEELNRVKVLAGLTEVRGPGVAVTLNDKPGFDVLKDPTDALVHDSDVRYVLDLLKASGAAALSVNDQRITNASYVFCIGPAILCNQQRLTPPYIIRAIGNPQAMAQAILSDPMLSLRQTKEIGLVVQVERSDTIVCPAFAEADDLEKYIDRLEVTAE